MIRPSWMLEADHYGGEGNVQDGMWRVGNKLPEQLPSSDNEFTQKWDPRQTYGVIRHNGHYPSTVFIGQDFAKFGTEVEIKNYYGEPLSQVLPEGRI